jgi:putative ABC transport system permease protein
MDGEFLAANDYLCVRDRQNALASMTSWRGTADCDLTEQSPLRLSCAQLEASFLPTFGIQPVLGRNFTREEDRPDANRQVRRWVCGTRSYRQS